MTERVDSAPAFGGAYSIVLYLDANGAEVDSPADAVEVHVTEYSTDGKWLGESVLKLEGG